MKRLLIRLGVVLAMLSITLSTGLSHAFATNPDCVTPYGLAQFGADWNPSYEVTGIEAPVQERTDGDVCQSDKDAGSAEWVGIQNSNPDNSYLAQGGFSHFWNNDLGHGEWCPFWEDAPDPPVYLMSSCSGVSNDGYEWWKVHVNTNGYYNIDWCGSAYASCVVENAGLQDIQDLGSTAYGIASGESLDPELLTNGDCAIQPTGDSGNPDNLGYGSDSTNQVKFQTTVSGPFSTETLSDRNVGLGPCSSEYQESRLQSDNVVVTWDTLNSN